MARTRVLLTGASGSMGGEAFQELLRRSDRIQTRLLLRPSKVNKKNFARYEGRDGLEIHWGDITSPEDVEGAVAGVDYVLHAAAMISPAADHAPVQARRINAGGAKNLIRAIQSQPRGGDDIRMVFVGSVAQYGDRLPPRHMINVGDPLLPSVGDYYALSKLEGETAVIESGIHFASLRQTYIAIPETLSLLDGILFHQPLNQHIELITARDAGYGLVQSTEAGDDFWGKVYNMSGGPSCRVSYEEYMQYVFSMLGMGDYRKIFERNWFATRNFHCGYFEDSHLLDAQLGHCRDTLEDHYRQMDESFAPWMRTGARLSPPFILKAVMKRMAEPLRWLRDGEEEKIDAFFGGREAWASIPRWDLASEVPKRLDAEETGRRSGSHGAGHTDDLVAFAEARGGQCHSLETSGDPRTDKRSWECAQGHRFQASVRLLVEAGYWCPACTPNFEDASNWSYSNRTALGDPLLSAYHAP